MFSLDTFPENPPIDRSRLHDRIKAAIASVLVQALLAWLLIAGLAVTMPGAVPEALKLFTIGAPPPPPPEKVPHHATTPRPAGAAAPANLRAKPAEIVAPPPVLTPPPQALATAPKPGPGSASSAGASNLPGPGTGSGGQGNGTGSGDEGDGDGDGGTVVTRFTVGANGRLSDCRVTQSSGNAELDATTCRIILQRYRFAPARDEHGRPVEDYAEAENQWVAHRVQQDDGP